MHKTQARQLRTVLAELGHPITPNLALEVLAAAHGHASWQQATHRPGYITTPPLPARDRWVAVQQRLERGGVTINGAQARAVSSTLDVQANVRIAPQDVPPLGDAAPEDASTVRALARNLDQTWFRDFTRTIHNRTGTTETF